MADPTPAEVEAGARAILRLGMAVGDYVRELLAAAVLRAVLPDHDAQVRAQVAEEIARIQGGCLAALAAHLRLRGRALPDEHTAEVLEALPDIARAHATTLEGDTDG